MPYFYCPRCQALVHPTEVEQTSDGGYKHTVFTYARADGVDNSIVHYSLIPQDF